MSFAVFSKLESLVERETHELLIDCECAVSEIL